jgi:hypothetical protein
MFHFFVQWLETGTSWNLRKLWVFYLYKFNYMLNKLGWFCTYSYKLCGFCNRYYRFSKLNKFNLNVVNDLIPIGFKFFLDATLCSCCIKLFPPTPPISFEQVHSSFFSKSTICDLKIVIDFFLNGKVTYSKLNLSFGVRNFVRNFN